MSIISKWYLAANAFNALDVVLTLWFLELGLHEANPVMASLLEISPEMFAVVKLGSLWAITSAWIWYDRLGRLVTASLLFAAVCVWNLVQISRAL